MSDAMMVIRHVFEGADLVSVVWDGRPCWVARHVGERIGYENGGRKFAQQVLGDWSSEFDPEKDYAFLEGEELRSFNLVSGEGPGQGPSQNGGRGLLVLFESGVNLALLKTRKPLGVRLRRFLADEVLPQLARTARYTQDPGEASANERMADLDRRICALESAVGGIAEGVAGIAQGVQALLAAQVPKQIAGVAASATPAPGIHMHFRGGAHVHIPDLNVPPEYSIHGIKALSEVEGVSHQRMRRRLENVRLWADEAWHWIGQRTVPRGTRLDTETVYRFKPGILVELRKRETPLFE